MRRAKSIILGTILGWLLVAGPMWAQEDVPGPPQDDDTQTVEQASLPDQQGNPTQPPQPTEDSNRPDPPDRAARLQYIQGSVSIQPQGTGDWVEGALNRPLTNNDNIWTDKNSRAELNVGSGILRLNSESSLTLTTVGDNAVQVELHQGTLTLRVRHLFDGEIYEVDTPNLAFTVQKNGEYRFDVDPNGDASVVTV